MTLIQLSSSLIQPERALPPTVFVSTAGTAIAGEEFLEATYAGGPVGDIAFSTEGFSAIVEIKYSSSVHPLIEYNNETVFLGEIFTRINQLRALEKAFGMLNDLTKEQIRTFDASIKRRRLFL